MFSIIESLFDGTFVALHAFFKQVNRVLSELVKGNIDSN